MNKINLKKKLNKYIIPILITFFNAIIIFFPKNSLSAAANGLKLWYNMVLPSLFPFLVATKLLSFTAVCAFLGELFSPLMLFLFKINGNGAYPLLSGFISGYPIGAKTTCDMYLSNSLKRNEANRLVGFANNSGPLFIISTVGSQLMGSEKTGYFFLFITISAAILTGIILSFFTSSNSGRHSRPFSLKRAIKAYNTAAESCNISAFDMLSAAISSSVGIILAIGGFIVIFSVISAFITLFMNTLHIPDFYSALISGFFEVTNGCSMLAGINADKKQLIPYICALISWGGLSIHAQSISIIIKTDLNIPLYLAVKLLQALTAFFLSYIIIHII